MKGLITRAYKGDMSILDHPDVSKVQGKHKIIPLHILAWTRKCDVVKIFNHPNVAKVKDTEGRTPLHILANRQDHKKFVDLLLQHPLFSKIQDYEGITPLHLLTRRYGNILALSHPDVAIVQDFKGNTPLHYLGTYGRMEILNHPLAKEVKNKEGLTPADLLEKSLYRLAIWDNLKILEHPSVLITNEEGESPLHFLAERNSRRIKNIRISTIRKLFPWYKIKDGVKEVTKEMLLDIANTSNFEIFLNSI